MVCCEIVFGGNNVWHLHIEKSTSDCKSRYTTGRHADIMKRKITMQEIGKWNVTATDPESVGVRTRETLKMHPFTVETEFSLGV